MFSSCFSTLTCIINNHFILLCIDFINLYLRVRLSMTILFMVSGLSLVSVNNDFLLFSLSYYRCFYGSSLYRWRTNFHFLKKKKKFGAVLRQDKNFVRVFHAA